MDLTKTHTLSYLCPDCKDRVYRDIQYIDPSLFAKPEEARITMSHWCSNCNARHEYTFGLKELKNGSVRVHTYSFFSNGAEYKKKLRLKKEDNEPQTEEDKQNGS